MQARAAAMASKYEMVHWMATAENAAEMVIEDRGHADGALLFRELSDSQRKGTTVASTPADRDTILRAIEAWPIEEQERLAKTILARAHGERSQASPSRNASAIPGRSTWDALYGIASGGREPPSDEEVAQWLDEHKMEKYGQ